jgi:hypothetical protein
VPTHLFFGLPELSIDIITRSPNSRNTLPIVPETIFKLIPQLGQNGMIRKLFPDLPMQSQPSSLSQDGERQGVFFFSTVEGLGSVKIGRLRFGKDGFEGNEEVVPHLLGRFGESDFHRFAKLFLDVPLSKRPYRSVD